MEKTFKMSNGYLQETIKTCTEPKDAWKELKLLLIINLIIIYLMKYIAYRLYVKAEDVLFIEDFDESKHGIPREYLGSNADESLNLCQFLNLLKTNGLNENTDLIVYVKKEESLTIIGKESKLKINTRVPILCGKLRDLLTLKDTYELTLKDIYERIHIEE